MGGLIKLVIFSFVLATLIYPGLEKLYLYRQTNMLEDLVMAPLGFLGENQTILSNDDKFTRYGTKYKELDLLPNQDLFIGIKNEFSFHERWVNLTEERRRVYIERFNTLRNIHQKISNGYYSLIAYGPFSDELDLVYLYYSLRSIEDPSKSGLSNIDDYCRIILPSTEHKCMLCKDTTRVFFKENETCSYVMQDIITYYIDNFYKACRLSELTANIQFRESMAANGFLILDKCENGGKLLVNYSDKAFRFDDFINLFYLVLTIFTIANLRYSKGLITLILIGLVVLLYVPLDIFNDRYISDYSLNETSYAYAKSIFSDPKFPPKIKALEVTHDASYFLPAEVGELEQKDLVIAGRYGNNDLIRKQA